VKLAVTIYSADQCFESGRMDVKGFIDFCAGLGVDAVDLGYYWKDEQMEIKEAPKWLKAMNLKLGSYIVGNDFAQKDPSEKKKHVEKVKHAIDMAVLIGADKLRIFGGDDKPGVSTYEEVRDIMVDCLKQVSAYAEQRKIILAMENHGGICSKAYQVLDLIKAVGSDYLKLNIDIGNFLAIGDDPVESTAKVIHLAVHAHLKDLKREGDKNIRTVVGEGDVDLAGCLKIFKKNNYKGYLSLEYEAPEDCISGMKRSMDNIKMTLAKI
jgi:sugar phosphate isomerase/epimerase